MKPLHPTGQSWRLSIQEAINALELAKLHDPYEAGMKMAEALGCIADAKRVIAWDDKYGEKDA